MERLIEALKQQQATLSTAESCTGGLIGKTLTDAAGSSDYYLGGVISYANSVKEAMLGVSAKSLSTVGAVSEEVAKQMAEGVRSRLKTTYGIATTGIAGPGGGTDEKPVGLVYMAIAGERDTVVYRHIFSGNRAVVREKATAKVFEYLLEYIEKQH